MFLIFKMQPTMDDNFYIGYVPVGILALYLLLSLGSVAWTILSHSLSKGRRFLIHWRYQRKVRVANLQQLH